MSDQWTPGLTEEEVAAYWRDGYLVIDNVLDSGELEALRTLSEAEDVISSRTQADYNSKTVHMLGLTGKHPAFLKLARHPGIINRIRSLLGADIQLQHSKLATKPPTKGKGEFPWHQDFAFYPHTNTDLLSVMVMLDDATIENGCMQMVKGSHKLGCLNHAVDGYFTGACQENQYMEQSENVADITPKAGGISIHHALTLHGSPANRSGKARRGIVFSYRADEAYQLAGYIFDDTGTLVAGSRSGQVRNDGQTYQLPRLEYAPAAPFGNAWNQAGENAKMSEAIV